MISQDKLDEMGLDPKSLIRDYYAYHREHVQSIKTIKDNFGAIAYRVKVRGKGYNVVTLCAIEEDRYLNPYVSEICDGSPEDEAQMIDEWKYGLPIDEEEEL